MVHHIVLMRLKPGITRDHAGLCAALAELIALPEQIGGIERWHHGWDFVGRPISCDFGLFATFSSRAAFDAYGPHPAHQAVAAKLREWVEWVLCDFEG